MTAAPARSLAAGSSRTEWFVHDRFGLFIHWGIYSVAARHEWIKHIERITDEKYQPYFDHFDPDLYDPVQWARDAKRAGMRYAVITTKHHDGFCLWDSQLTDYKAPNTPAGRDLIAEWVNAFRAEGLKVGFYHSVIDWHHPDYSFDHIHPQYEDALVGPPAQGTNEHDRAIDQRLRKWLRGLPDREPLAEALADANADRDIARYRDYLWGQVRELLTNYGKIDIMWFDFSYPGVSGKGRADWHSPELAAMVRELQPGIIINDRLDYPEEADFWKQLKPAIADKLTGRLRYRHYEQNRRRHPDRIRIVALAASEGHGWAIARANATLCCWPPLISTGKRSAIAGSLMRLSSSSTRARASPCELQRPCTSSGSARMEAMRWRGLSEVDGSW